MPSSTSSTTATSRCAPADLARSHALLRQGVGEILGAGAIPIVLGGDHSLSTPVLQALAAHHGADGFSVVHFDTHADTGSYEGEAPHGVPFHRAVVEGDLDGRNIVQIGLRGAWPFPEDFRWMRGAGFRWHTAGEIVERGIAAVVNDAIEHARVACTADLPDGRHRRARSGLRARHRHRRARGSDDPRAPVGGAHGGEPARPVRDGHRRGVAAV